MFNLRLERTNLAANDEAHIFEHAIEKEAILNQIGRGRVVLVRIPTLPSPISTHPTPTTKKSLIKKFKKKTLCMVKMISITDNIGFFIKL